MTNAKILDTTLRDGSYVIDFKFSFKQTELIVSELDKFGIELIEVGHGVGLGASEAGIGKAFESDENYMKAASTSCKNSKWGMFCIPGIAKMDHIDLAADYRMDFIRVGSNVDEVLKTKEFITKAKKYGIKVFSNFMKSYLVTPQEFVEISKQSKSYGADGIYLVDSAGGMFPNEIINYSKEFRDSFGESLQLGFHGHNNLGLAVSNSIIALNENFDIIDTSLQGMGRSAGNTPTEILVLLLKKLFNKNYNQNYLDILQIGQKYIRPLLKNTGVDSLDIISGYSLFHSSYMPVIRSASELFSVDPHLLIVELCKINKMDAPEKLVFEIAKKISEDIISDKFSNTKTHDLIKYSINEQSQNNSKKNLD